MRRRSLILFVILNVFISLAVAFGVISLMGSGGQQPASQIVITVPILVTSTTDPNVTPIIKIITATPLPGSIGVLPTGLLPDASAAPGTLINTFDAQALGDNPGLVGTATALPPGCILYTIQEGDTPFSIAEQLGADGQKLMEVNGLTEETATLLQIGQVLIVPLEGCSLTAAEVAVATPTQESLSNGSGEATAETTAEAQPTVRPTLTLPPTAANAQVQIVEVKNPGDVTSESVTIKNVGDTINVKGWTLSDSQGNSYTFSERYLFSQAIIVINTRVGTDTPQALFWNRQQAAFGEPDDVLTLKNDKGVVQSTYRIPASVNLP
jgi:LysM repeat protein